ncbi:uncharacterized protein ATNIH1004_003935 [Aspergillus tanneri]|uniref:HTH psq-type domain-containing protein n=1 Tax=Aspergillus tanneri TaxID=1220188 RepID=A0A5M9MM18_9EURO|nr:uncharacterized protein ATNIH1004_003935 [Aspergillus tanneri]KAA8648052.1 hypothetical protein ATNIH1004_003935 [Aspergillus tanneri]
MATRGMAGRDKETRQQHEGAHVAQTRVSWKLKAKVRSRLQLNSKTFHIQKARFWTYSRHSYDINILIGAAYSNALHAYDERNDSETLPSIAKFAREFGVSYRRLWARINGRDSKSTRQPVNLQLDFAQYQKLFDYIDRQYDSDGLVSANATRKAANTVYRRVIQVLQRHHQKTK